MSLTVGIDLGSTYTKAIVLKDGDRIVARTMRRTGCRLEEAAEETYRDVMRLTEGADADYVVATGFGRHQVPFRDAQVTDLTAGARGARFLFPDVQTVLDVGGQTMKASRLDPDGRVRSFRLNDKCAAGTGAFLEKTARYMGFSTEEIGPLAATSKEPVPISGVCAVFAESEVINHLSQGCAPADIMHGAMASLAERSLQLLRRVRMEPKYALVGGILRFEPMVRSLMGSLGEDVRLPEGDLVQYVNALGAARLGFLRRNRSPQATPAQS